MDAQLLLTDANLPEYLRGLGLAAPGERVQVEPAGDGNINWVRRATVEASPPRSLRREAGAARARALPAVPGTDRADRVRGPLPGARSRRSTPRGSAPGAPLRRAQSRARARGSRAGRAARRGPRARGGREHAARRASPRFLGRVHARDARATDARRALRERRRCSASTATTSSRSPSAERLPAAAAHGRRAPSSSATTRRSCAIAAPPTRATSSRRARSSTATCRPATCCSPARGAKLLDAEIAHVGDPAFDIGTLLAHCWLLPAARGGRARERAPLIERCWRAYAEAHGRGAGAALARRALRYAGLELLRRTIGAARVAAVAERRSRRSACSSAASPGSRGALAAQTPVEPSQRRQRLGAVGGAGSPLRLDSAAQWMRW